MSRSIFGWSYPPGCSGPPEDGPYSRQIGKPRRYHAATDYRCSGCGDWIKRGDLYNYDVFVIDDEKIEVQRTHIRCLYWTGEPEYEHEDKLEENR